MITEKDLREAIAECQGERNPNANTCIKLAAYYTILDNIIEKPLPRYDNAYSGSMGYDSDTEFGRILKQKTTEEIMAVMDELMTTLTVVNPRLYESVIRKLTE